MCTYKTLSASKLAVFVTYFDLSYKICAFSDSVFILKVKKNSQVIRIIYLNEQSDFYLLMLVILLKKIIIGLI